MGQKGAHVWQQRRRELLSCSKSLSTELYCAKLSAVLNGVFTGLYTHIFDITKTFTGMQLCLFSEKELSK